MFPAVKGVVKRVEIAEKRLIVDKTLRRSGGVLAGVKNPRTDLCRTGISETPLKVGCDFYRSSIFQNAV
ncbi:MAG: hypothetical protein ACLS4Z_07585 [Christensenellaceae bacterium]